MELELRTFSIIISTAFDRYFLNSDWQYHVKRFFKNKIFPPYLFIFGYYHSEYIVPCNEMRYKRFIECPVY